MSERPYAEDLPYWKTSQSGSDKWIDKAVREIGRADGEVLAEGFVRNEGESVFMIRFALDGDTFRVIWPVLASKSGDVRAAKVQTATMLYHDVKSSCVKARALGARVAFFAHLEVDGQRVASQLGAADLVADWPRLLPSAAVVDVEVEEVPDE